MLLHCVCVCLYVYLYAYAYVCVCVCVCLNRIWAIIDKKGMTNTSFIQCERDAGQPGELTEENQRFTRRPHRFPRSFNHITMKDSQTSLAHHGHFLPCLSISVSLPCSCNRSTVCLFTRGFSPGFQAALALPDLRRRGQRRPGRWG